METKVQIEILREAKRFIKLGYGCRGLCLAITNSIVESNVVYNKYNSIVDVIPSFNEINVEILCRKHNLDLPNGLFYWWPVENIEVRLQVLDLLIKDLQNENQNS